jgi:general secretion pathway protein H
MPTSAPGSNTRAAGFTLLELLIVIAIVALSAGVVTLALRDSSASRLEEEGERLVALLEMARAESRVSGTTVRWLPAGGAAGSSGVAAGTAAGAPDADFRFVGLHRDTLPSRWLDRETRAQVAGSPFVVLGPQAILPPQRVVLSLGPHRLEVASDGLAPFAVAAPAP